MIIGPTEGRLPAFLPTEAEHPPENAPGGATSEPSAFAKMLDGLGREVNQGEAMTRTALRQPHNLGPSELLALQAGIYRYNESIDLASRLVVGASNSLHTVLQNQS
jgi:hypothetical protein